MTEKEFLNLFNEIDDKFIDEEQERIAPQYPVKIQYSSVKKSAAGSFSWGRFAATAAVCAVAAGGIFAAGHYFGGGEFQAGNTNTVPYHTVAADTYENFVKLPEDQQPVLYETELSCNGKIYTLTARLHGIYGDESIDGVTELDKKYIWGDVILELFLNGKLMDTSYIPNFRCDRGQVNGNPPDTKNSCPDYFMVLPMGEDVLFYLSPNVEIGAEDENDYATLNAMFFTVDKNDNLIAFQRYVIDEEKKEPVPVPDYSSSYFKLTPDLDAYHLDAYHNELTLHLKQTVKNPWAENGAVFLPGSIPLSFDFENYTIRCEDEYYKYLVYCYTGPIETVD